MFVFATLAIVAAEKSKLLVKNLGQEDLGLYFLGAVDGILDGSETACETMAPGETAGRYVHHNDSFALRSGDLKWRSRITVFGGDHLRPFKLSFHNSMHEEPIEFVDGGFLWIEANHHVTHSTVGGHNFIINDKEREPRFSVQVHELDNDEF